MAVLLLLFGVLLLLVAAAEVPVPVAAFVLLLVFHGHWWGWYCCFIVRLPPCVCGAILVLMEVAGCVLLRKVGRVAMMLSVVAGLTLLARHSR